jgi:hypothetical protein
MEPKDDFAKLNAERLLRGLHGRGLPQKSEGFWDNVGVCCGNAGIAAMLLDRSGDNPANLALARELVDDLLSRATRIELASGVFGLKWAQAEHRVRPEFRQAQTGLMQGAAGVGMVLLKLHCRLAGIQDANRFPMLPL